jgi:hypothetical protein
MKFDRRTHLRTNGLQSMPISGASLKGHEVTLTRIISSRLDYIIQGVGKFSRLCIVT